MFSVFYVWYIEVKILPLKLQQRHMTEATHSETKASQGTEEQVLLIQALDNTLGLCSPSGVTTLHIS